MKEFYAKQGFTPTYKSVDGQQVEVEYDREFGMAGLLHIAMRAPSAAWLFRVFL